MICIISLPGCLGTAAMIGTTAAETIAATSVGSNMAVDNELDWLARAERMNCSQLRDEYERVINPVAMLIPFQGSRRAFLMDLAKQRGCRL